MWDDDMYFKHKLDESTIRQCLATGLQVPVDEVTLTDDIEKLPQECDPLVLCEIIDIGGDFPVRLRLIFRGSRPTKDGAQQQLVDLLDSECIISDDSINPFRWILLRPHKPAKPVFVDDVALGRDQLRLADEGDEFD